MTQQYTFRLRISRPDALPRTVDLRLGATVLGRQPDSDIMLDHDTVSRHHARIDCTPTACQIADLGSTNGTFVNGAQLVPNTPVLLPAGAVVKVGMFELVAEQVPVQAARKETPQPVVAPPPRPARPAPGAAGGPAPAAPAAKPPAAPPAAPPRKPRPPQLPPEPAPPPEELIPPGLSLESRRLINYLPGIYHTPFMSRFLALFESILLPIEWTVDGFDLFLHPGTAPAAFLPWLAGWFGLTFDDTWSEPQLRTLLSEAYRLYGRRGTRGALARVLEIYTGVKPEIVDNAKGLAPYTFEVTVPLPENKVDRGRVAALINAHKPAHTSYTLRFRP